VLDISTDSAIIPLKATNNKRVLKVDIDKLWQDARATFAPEIQALGSETRALAIWAHAAESCLADNVRTNEQARAQLTALLQRSMPQQP
jgi:hypothetical protein